LQGTRLGGHLKKSAVSYHLALIDKDKRVEQCSEIDGCAVIVLLKEEPVTKKMLNRNGLGLSGTMSNLFEGVSIF
jgi:hypothetical protein